MTMKAHVTRVAVSTGQRYDVYGHETCHCDAAGCNGQEQYLGWTDPDGGSFDALSGEPRDGWVPRAGDIVLVHGGRL